MSDGAPTPSLSLPERLRAACAFATLVLAAACIVVPSWPLAFACAVVAGVFAAHVWEADRQREIAKVRVEISDTRTALAELRAAYVEHAKAISELKHRTVAQSLEGQAGFPDIPPAPWEQGPRL